MNVEVLEKEFQSKIPELIKAFEDWFEKEGASIDDVIANSAPSGTGGSIISARSAIDSKRVLDATSITEEVLGVEMPPEIIKPGGYETCQEMIDDLLPKLEKVYTGKQKIKKPKVAATPAKVKEDHE